MRPGIWIRAVRAPFFTAAIVPVLVGTAAAFSSAHAFNALYFLLALIGMVFIHAGINLGNDYFDQKTDAQNKTPTPFSGGSRVIQDGLISANDIFLASMISFFIGSSIGLYLYMQLGATVLALGIAGVFIGFFYTAPPFKFGYRGIGEIMVGLGFGTIIVAGAYFVQAGAINATALLASVPVAVLIALVLLINEFPDHDADKRTGKRTLVVILGKKNAVRIYQIMLAFVYFWTAAMVIAGAYPIFTLVTLLTIPMATKAIRTAGANYSKINELLPANAATIMLHLSFGLLLALGFAVSGFI